MELNHFSFQLDVFVLEQEKLAMSVFDPNLHLVQNMMKHRNFRHRKGKKNPAIKNYAQVGYELHPHIDRILITRKHGATFLKIS